MTPTVTIKSISISHGARRTKVRTPDGVVRVHNLGTVGEPLRPYLGHRAEGYALALPDDMRDLQVYRVLWDLPPRTNGAPQIKYVRITDLDAPDLFGNHRPEED